MRERAKNKPHTSTRTLYLRSQGIVRLSQQQQGPNMSVDQSVRMQTYLEKLVDTAEELDRSLLREERILMNIKWFEYRFLSPAQATKLFVRTYQEVFRRFFASNIDCHQAKNANGINLTTFKDDPRVRTQVWKARQRADATGMPYNYYLDAAFAFGVRRQRKMLPQPNQLHFPGAANAEWVKFREERWSMCLRDMAPDVENHPAFRIENYCGLPAQDAYREFIVQEGGRHHRDVAGLISKYFVQKRQVPAELFRGLVPDYIFQRAKDRVRDSHNALPIIIDPMPEHGKHDLWPSCFGLPTAQDRLEAPCRQCALADGCQQLSLGVTQKVSQRCGTDNPKAARTREKARDRQRRKRQRDRGTGDQGAVA